jgi:predicted aspartyl protease
VVVVAVVAHGCRSAADETPRLGIPASVALDSVVEVPFDMDHRKPVVSARINGQGPFRLLLDTSAGTSVLDDSLARELGLVPVKKQSVGDPADPEAVEADVVAVESIELGGAAFRGVEVLSWDRSGLYGGADPPRGVLGFPLFAVGLLTIDYAAGKIRLEPGALPPVDGRDVLPFHLGVGGIPEIAVRVGGRTLDANVDTGSTAALSVPTALAAELPFTGEPIVVGRGRTATAEFVIRAATLDGTLGIGRHEIAGPRVILNERLTTANLGSALLQRFVVTFDQANLRVRFRANPGE